MLTATAYRFRHASGDCWNRGRTTLQRDDDRCCGSQRGAGVEGGAAGNLLVDQAEEGGAGEYAESVGEVVHRLMVPHLHSAATPTPPRRSGALPIVERPRRLVWLTARIRSNLTRSVDIDVSIIPRRRRGRFPSGERCADQSVLANATLPKLPRDVLRVRSL